MGEDNLRKRVISVLLLFFILSSNISSGLMSLFSFVTDKTIYNFSNTVNIQEQCSMLINMPKEFVNICVKVGCDIKTLVNSENKVQYIFTDNYKFDQTPIALIYSTTKIKVIKSITEYRNLLFSFINTSIKIFVIPIIIFYLLCYIGLLRLFGSISLLLSLINSVRNSVYLHT